VAPVAETPLAWVDDRVVAEPPVHQADDWIIAPAAKLSRDVSLAGAYTHAIAITTGAGLPVAYAPIRFAQLSETG
jgi:hypothetical protein